MALRTRLGIDIDADTSGVDRGVSSTGSKLSSFGRNAARAGAAAAAGIGLAVVAGGKLAAMAAGDQKAQVQLATTLRNTTGARKEDIAGTEAWITAQGKALGVTDDDLRPAIGRLAVATGDLDKAQRLTSIAMDVSAGTGKSLTQVTEALQKAQNGSLGGLSRLGVATKDQQGNTLSLKEVTQDLAKAYDGQASKAADTAAGKFERLKLQFTETAEGVGAKLLPMVERLGGWLLDEGIPAATRLGKQLSDTLGPALRAVGGFIQNRVIPAGVKLYEWFVEKIAPGIKRTLTPILQSLRDAWGEIAQVLDENSEDVDALKSGLAKFVEFCATKVAPFLTQTLGPAIKVIGQIAADVIETVLWLIGKIQVAIGWADKLLNKGTQLDDQGFVDTGTGYQAPQDQDGGSGGNPLIPGGGNPRSVPKLPPGSGRQAPIVQDYSVSVNVDGSGVVDENAIAQKLTPILERHARRIGARR